MKWRKIFKKLKEYIFFKIWVFILLKRDDKTTLVKDINTVQVLMEIF
jgi:hypothetical protein